MMPHWFCQPSVADGVRGVPAPVFSVQLAAKPGGSVTVTVARKAGDERTAI